MSRLFIELYLDEDVNVLIAELVRRRGFKATAAHEVGQKRRKDEEQLAYAVSQQKTLLTHNRNDFEALAQQYFAANQKHYGIIIAVRRPPSKVFLRLMGILNQVTADEMENQIRYI